MPDRPVVPAPSDERQPNETQTDYMDRRTRDHMDAVAERWEAMRSTVINAAGNSFRMSHAGYGAHLGTRHTALPRQIKDWIEAGCPESGAVS